MIMYMMEAEEDDVLFYSTQAYQRDSTMKIFYEYMEETYDLAGKFEKYLTEGSLESDD